MHLGREFLQEVQGPVVFQRVHRVQPQPVEVVIAEPHQRVADKKRAYLVRAGLVQVHRGTPGRHVRLGEVRPEVAQPVADADVVVHHVEQDGQAALVTGVDEPLQPVGAAVGLVHRPQVDPVVAPAVPAGERRHRHQLHRVHTEVAQVVKPPDGRVEGALGGKGADVQFVDHRAVQRAAAPPLVRPAEGGVIVGAAQALDAERLPQRTRIRQRLAVVQPEPVVDADRHVGHVRAPPARAILLAHRIPLARDLYLGLTRDRRPDTEGGQREPPSARRSCSIS